MKSVYFKSSCIPILFDISSKHTVCSVMISEELYTGYPLQTPALRKCLVLYPGRVIGGAVATRMRVAVIPHVLKVRLLPPLLHSKRIRSSPNADFLPQDNLYCTILHDTIRVFWDHNES